MGLAHSEGLPAAAWACAPGWSEKWTKKELISTQVPPSQEFRMRVEV